MLCKKYLVLIWNVELKEIYSLFTVLEPLPANNEYRVSSRSNYCRSSLQIGPNISSRNLKAMSTKGPAKGTEEASTLPAADSAGDEDKQSEAAAADKQPAMTEETDKQVEKAGQVDRQILSTEQGDNTAEDLVTDEQPQALAEKKLTEKLKRLKNNKKAALSAVTKTRNELGKVMMRDENLHEVKTIWEVCRSG